MRILYVTTIGATMAFFQPLIRQLLDDGHTVDIAANISRRDVPPCYRQWGCQVHPITCSRSPVSPANAKAVGQIRALVRKQSYDIVHCHTPVAALCTRMACIGVRKRGTKVFYTAHGFHFYRGGPMKNWLIYYPLEWLCSHFTDVLITINREDYALARRRLRAQKVAFVPGVGIDLEAFQPGSGNKEELRRELGLPDGPLMLSVGELNENKNHSLVIRAMAAMADTNVHYAVAGMGPQTEKLQQLARKLQVQDRVHLLGYREDMPALYSAADIFVQPSFREGLPVSLAEAMASSLPCAVSNVRGNRDLIDGAGGVFFDPASHAECRAALEALLGSQTAGMGWHNQQKVKVLDVSGINSQMIKLYENV